LFDPNVLVFYIELLPFIGLGNCFGKLFKIFWPFFDALVTLIPRKCVLLHRATLHLTTFNLASLHLRSLAFQAAVQPPLFVGANLTIQGSKVNINPQKGG
jgi:hypothetical protein